MNLEKELQRDMAESMMKDVISSKAYDRLIKGYKKLFKDKVNKDPLICPNKSLLITLYYRLSWTLAVAVDCSA